MRHEKHVSECLHVIEARCYVRCPLHQSKPRQNDTLAVIVIRHDIPDGGLGICVKRAEKKPNKIIIITSGHREKESLKGTTVTAAPHCTHTASSTPGSPLPVVEVTWLSGQCQKGRGFLSELLASYWSFACQPQIHPSHSLS